MVQTKIDGNLPNESPLRKKIDCFEDLLLEAWTILRCIYYCVNKKHGDSS